MTWRHFKSSTYPGQLGAFWARDCPLAWGNTSCHRPTKLGRPLDVAQFDLISSLCSHKYHVSFGC